MSSQYYKRLLSSVNISLSGYRKRKSQLETIRDNYSLFDSYANDLNGYCDSCSINSSMGIVITGGSNDTSSVIGAKDEGAGDDNLSSSKEYIKAEIRNVNSKIEELERSSNYYNSKIRQEEQRERAEIFKNLLKK